MQALVVDDDLEILSVIREVLASNNFRSVCVQSPSDALERAKNEHYHVIILDVKMPEMDGFELTHRLREQGVKSPIIGLTGFPELGESLMKQRDGKKRQKMDVILAKPFDYEDFYAAVGRVAERIDYLESM